MSVLGAVAYTVGDGWFKRVHSHEFSSKNSAQLTLVGWIAVSGLVGPKILDLIQAGLVPLTMSQTVGLVLVTTRAFTNDVAGWTHSDGMSVFQYFVGFVLFVLPQLQ